MVPQIYHQKTCLADCYFVMTSWFAIALNSPLTEVGSWSRELVSFWIKHFFASSCLTLRASFSDTARLSKARSLFSPIKAIGRS